MKNNLEYILHQDVILESVSLLSDSSKEKLEFEESDYTIFRKGSRSKAKIISKEVYSFMCHFREPLRVVDAVKVESLKINVSSSELLKEVYNFTNQMIKSSFLVQSGEVNKESLTPSIEIGSMFKNYYVHKCLWLLEDTEVYELYTEDNKKLILKLGKIEFKERISELFKREAHILGLIDGGISPKVIEQDTYKEMPYVLMEWCNGKTINVVLNGLLKEHTVESHKKIILIIQKLLKAYSILHEKGIIHGDVNQKNILFTINEEIKIIDFGNSFTHESIDGVTVGHRNGFSEYYDPQLITAKLNRKKLPLASIYTDQYSIAAMLYYCITSNFHIDFNLDKEKMYNQIISELPRSFESLGFIEWHNLETILTKALSKNESDRYNNLNSIYIDSLKLIPCESCQSEIYNLKNELFEDYYKSFLNDSMDFTILKNKVIDTSPKSQFNFGLSGIAYSLYRLSKLEDDPKLLAQADLWNTTALDIKNDENAYYSNKGDVILSQNDIGLNSIYHTQNGSIIVEILIAITLGDYATIERSIKTLIDRIDFSCKNYDLTVGFSGLLIGFQAILDAAKGTEFEKLVFCLIDLGNKIAQVIYEKISPSLPLYMGKDIKFLGIAHGWTGILYSLMSWESLDKERYSNFIQACTNQIMDFMVITSNGLSMPKKIPNFKKKPEYLTSWCNGSSGLVFFWLKAYDFFKNTKYISYAELLGEFTWKTKEKYQTLDICCGLTGKAYSFISIYKKTNDIKWLNRAKTFISKAIKADEKGHYVKRYSLIKGYIGLSLLCKEISSPENAVLPLFEKEL